MAEPLSVSRALGRSGLVPIDAQILLAHVLGVDRAWLVAHAGDPLPAVHLDAFLALAKRRIAGEPVAYLVGRRGFHAIELEVTPAVLVPRPETETVVDFALERLPPDRDVAVLDLGTGSARSRWRSRMRGRVRACSRPTRRRDALDVARANARRLGLANVAFAAGDWYDALPADAPAFDLIASNPPYVAYGDPHLDAGDLVHEPRLALTPGGDGLDALRVIVAGAPARLVAGGTLVVEHGYDQADDVRALFEAAGFERIESRRDLAGIPRAMAGVH